MPERVTKALALLERALVLDPNYALAHAFAAMCHHCLFLRARLLEESKMASVRHAQAAILHGQDDALALTFAGFSIGMDGHEGVLSTGRHVSLHGTNRSEGLCFNLERPRRDASSLS
jgi:hypothetical protein